MFEITHLLKLIDAYQKARDVSDTTLSFWMFNDSKKIAALRTGSDMTTTRFNAAVQYFSDNWPESAVWPLEVPRPKVEA